MDAKHKPYVAPKRLTDAVDAIVRHAQVYGSPTSTELERLGAKAHMETFNAVELHEAVAFIRRLGLAK